MKEIDTEGTGMKKKDNLKGKTTEQIREDFARFGKFKKEAYLNSVKNDNKKEE